MAEELLLLAPCLMSLLLTTPAYLVSPINLLAPPFLGQVIFKSFLSGFRHLSVHRIIASQSVPDLCYCCCLVSILFEILSRLLCLNVTIFADLSSTFLVVLLYLVSHVCLYQSCILLTPFCVTMSLSYVL